MMIKFFRSVSYVNTIDSYSGILTFMASQLKYMVRLCNSWVNNDILLLENWTQYSTRCYKTLRCLSVVNMIWCTHFLSRQKPFSWIIATNLKQQFTIRYDKVLLEMRMTTQNRQSRMLKKKKFRKIGNVEYQ